MNVARLQQHVFYIFGSGPLRSSEKRGSRARGLALFGVVHLKIQYQRRQAICLSLSLPLWPRMREQPSHSEVVLIYFAIRHSMTNFPAIPATAMLGFALGLLVPKADLARSRTE